MVANKRYFDPIAQVPYIYNSETKLFITYEDPESKEAKENGVTFVPVFSGNRQTAAEKDLRELEMFGSFQMKQFGKYNNF